MKKLWSGFTGCFARMKGRAHPVEAPTEKQAAPKPEETTH
jgi:hypothetical protein